ncbi:MAG: methyltransferase [Christensenellales bacterium]
MHDLNKIAELNNLTLDYLNSGSPIFQVKGGYNFTSDSVKLASTVTEEEIDTLVDFCSGSGIVGLEVIERATVNNLYSFEIQEELYNACLLSQKHNKFNTKFYTFLKPVQQASNYVTNADVVICNPPFFKANSGGLSLNNSKLLARHEVTITLNEIFKSASEVLKSGGVFYLLHIADRSNEIEKLALSFNFKIESRKELEGHLKRVIFKFKNVK